MFVLLFSVIQIMKLLRDTELSRRNGVFDIVTETSHCQVATMVLQPGELSGEYGNEHPGSDQLLYVMEGKAEATVEGKKVELREDDVILIEAGEKHQIRCAGEAILRTLNVYTPPGY